MNEKLEIKVSSVRDDFLVLSRSMILEDIKTSQNKKYTIEEINRELNITN